MKKLKSKKIDNNIIKTYQHKLTKSNIFITFDSDFSNLTSHPCSIFINQTTNNGIYGGLIDGIINKKGGKQLLHERMKMFKNKKNQNLLINKGIFTSAPNLPFNYLFHIYTPNYMISDFNEANIKLEEMYYNIFKNISNKLNNNLNDNIIIMPFICFDVLNKNDKDYKKKLKTIIKLNFKNIICNIQQFNIHINLYLYFKSPQLCSDFIKIINKNILLN